MFRCYREVYSSCVGSHLVSGGGPLSDCSLCLLHGSESTQPCLCRPHYTVEEDIGDPGDTVRCHSDLITCCSPDEGNHRGSWFFPDGDLLVLVMIL